MIETVNLTPCLTPEQIELYVTSSFSTVAGMKIDEHIQQCEYCRLEMEKQFAMERLCIDLENHQSNPKVPSVPGYEIDSFLGKGAFGNVWKATNLQLRSRWCVLKVLSTNQLGFRNLDLLRSEAEAMASLKSHPNRVTIYDLIEHDDTLILVMEYIPDGPLSSSVPLSTERASTYTLQIAEALRDLHNQGMIHRDIKPANILFDQQSDRAVLGDYGLVCLDGTHGLVGTPGYLAPELEDGNASQKTDVFALAATLFHLLTGKAPFDRNGPYHNLQQSREFSHELLAQLDDLPDFQEFIRLGLAPVPEERIDLTTVIASLQVIRNSELIRRLWQPISIPNEYLKLTVTLTRSSEAQQKGHTSQSFTNEDNPFESDSEHEYVVYASTDDKFLLEVEANQEGHLTILELTSTGILEKLFPNPKWNETKLKTNVPMPHVLRLEPPSGRLHWIFLWTDIPDPLTETQWKEILKLESDQWQQLLESQREPSIQMNQTGKRVRSYITSLSGWTATIVPVEHYPKRSFDFIK